MFGRIGLYSYGQQKAGSSPAFVLKLIVGFRMNAFIPNGGVQDNTFMGKRKEERPARMQIRMAEKSCG